MKKTSLYLLTDSFPYGAGEKTFIIPEIECLRQSFNVTIISSAPLCEKNNLAMQTILPEDIQLYHYDEKSKSYLRMVKNFFDFCNNEETRRECRLIFSTKKRVWERIKKTFFFFFNAKEFADWIVKEKIIKSDEKVIFYSYWFNYHVFSAIMCKKNYPQMKIITRAHGYDLYKERNDCCWQPMKTMMDKVIDKVFFISEHGYDYYIKNFAVNRQNNKKYDICRLGVFEQQKLEKKEKGRPFVLVSCSNVIPIKRIQLIIEALAKIEEENINWIHFGTGSELSNLEQHAKKLLENKRNIIYRFNGWTENDMVCEFYREKSPDCFIMPSQSEGSPVAMQEALSFGIPVIGTDVGGISEMIDGNGVLLSANPQIEEIADAIRFVYRADDSQYEAMCQRSLDIWKKDYDREKNVRKFVKILYDLEEEPFEDSICNH